IHVVMSSTRREDDLRSDLTSPLPGGPSIQARASFPVKRLIPREECLRAIRQCSHRQHHTREAFDLCKLSLSILLEISFVLDRHTPCTHHLLFSLVLRQRWAPS
ncbi:MAG: hypothetical protein M1823_006929, partial [Watsoniomyces obsoletus]